jgi:hypothetical protein
MFVLFVFLSLIVSQIYGTCPSGSVQSITTSTICYSFYSVPQSYADAEQICTDQRGHLVSIDNGFTNVFITEQAQKIYVRLNATNFWIGANDLASPGVWSWTDGKPFSYADWGQGQPSTEFGNDCVKVSMTNGFWLATNCFEKYPFICIIPSLLGPTCPARCDSGWSLYNSSCYKMNFNHNWDDAEVDCVTNGGHLASIHSTQENIFISTLARTGLDSDTSKQPWIGLKSTDGSNWFWSDGTPTDFKAWGNKQPDSGNTKQCAQIFADKSNWPQDSGLYEKWQSFDCSKSARAYVCKKAATTN